MTKTVLTLACVRAASCCLPRRAPPAGDNACAAWRTSPAAKREGPSPTEPERRRQARGRRGSQARGTARQPRTPGAPKPPSGDGEPVSLGELTRTDSRSAPRTSFRPRP